MVDLIANCRLAARHETAWAMEDGEVTIGIFMHARLGLDEVGAGLIAASAVSRRRCCRQQPYAPLGPPAPRATAPEQLARRRAFFGGGIGEAAVVGGKIRVLDEAVGRFEGSDVSELEVLGQAILKRPERARSVRACDE